VPVIENRAVALDLEFQAVDPRGARNSRKRRHSAIGLPSMESTRSLSPEIRRFGGGSG
jgi:hypothetical protein